MCFFPRRELEEEFSMWRIPVTNRLKKSLTNMQINIARVLAEINSSNYTFKTFFEFYEENQKKLIEEVKKLQKENKDLKKEIYGDYE